MNRQFVAEHFGELAEALAGLGRAVMAELNESIAAMLAAVHRWQENSACQASSRPRLAS